MYQASYGYPSDNPDEIVWITLNEFISREGTDPKEWRTRPYCPHCKTVLRTYDVKGSKGFYLVSQEITDPELAHLRRPVVGFSHMPRTAKKDCPYSYINNPHFNYQPSRHTAARERKLNMETITEPLMAKALSEVLRYLMQRLTGEKKISPQNRKILKWLFRTRIAHMPGIASHPWLVPYMQVVLFGTFMRIYSPETAGAAPPKRRRGPEKRAWRNVGVQKFSYTSANNELRVIEAPREIQLCFVHEKNIGVSYVPMRPDGKKPINFEVSDEFARGILRQKNKRKKKILLRGRKEARRLLLHYRKQLPQLKFG